MGIPCDKSEANDTCRACKCGPGEPFEGKLVVGHWEHEIVCPHVRHGESLCHSKWLPCKEQFPPVKFIPPNLGKRTTD